MLQNALGDEYKVVLGMRYQNPSIESASKEIEAKGYNKVIVLPLFPQYASASTGSAVEEALRVLGKWEITPHIEVISKFFDHPLFIKAFAEIGRKYLNEKSWDHIIFSFHGIPERQIIKGFEDETPLRASTTKGKDKREVIWEGRNR